MEVSISSSLWRLGTLSKQSEKKELARDAAIAIGRHVSPLRGKGQLGWKWTCVRILRKLNWVYFEMFIKL